MVFPKYLSVISKIEKCGCHIRIKLPASLLPDNVHSLLLRQPLPVWPV